MGSATSWSGWESPVVFDAWGKAQGVGQGGELEVGLDAEVWVGEEGYWGAGVLGLDAVGTSLCSFLVFVRGCR